jgi:competence protein ComEC
VNNISISADLRLSIPVLCGWGMLVVALLSSGVDSGKSYVTIGSLFLIAVISVVMIRRWPVLGLSGCVSAALLISLLLQLPSHIPTHPWDEVQQGPLPWWLEWSEELRLGFLDVTAAFPSVGGQLIPGLAIGDTRRVSESLNTAMKAVSLTHITAVSGANCAIVTATVMALATLCGAGRKLRLFIAAVALIAFVIVVTPQPSVVRAAVMAIVVMISLFSGRPGSGLPLLAVAALLLLMWNPWWAIDFGFILSVSATAGLLLFSGPLTTSLSRWFPFWLAAVIAIPVSAQLLCQPFIILLSPQLPTYGVLANVLVAPAAPLATLLGLVACLTASWAPILAQPVLWLTWLPAEWIGQTALVIARFPCAQIPWMAGPLGSLAAAALSTLVLLALLSPRDKVRKTSAVALVVSVVLWSATSIVSGLRFTASLPDDWSIAACDVGQGDALVLMSKDHIAVIDVGRKPEPLKQCLEQLHINRIHLLVLTHFDKDHVGGLDAVLGKVDSAVVGKPENLEDEGLLRDLARSGAKLTRGMQGLEGTLGDAQWHVLWPDTHHPLMELGNPGSVTLLVAFPTFRALFLGDLGREAQLALLSSVELPTVEVVKVAHHGSADQSSTLYEKIHPAIGLFSVGADNDYGHPRQEILSILRNMGTLTPRTDQDGLILVSSTPQGLSVWTEH